MHPHEPSFSHDSGARHELDASREPELLPELTPPANGLAGALARIRVQQDAPSLKPEPWRAVMARAHSDYLSLLAGGSLAAAFLLLLPTPRASDVALDRLVGARGEGTMLRVLDEGTAAQALESSQPGVRLYWTESLKPAPVLESQP